MTDLKSDDWRGPFSGDFRDESVFALENIGAQLQFKLAHIVSEPLTPELSDLLHKLGEALHCKPSRP